MASMVGSTYQNNEDVPSKGYTEIISNCVTAFLFIISGMVLLIQVIYFIILYNFCTTKLLFLDVNLW